MPRTPIKPGLKTQTLYLRHAPVGLMHRVRCEAARRRLTMEYVVVRAMQLGLPVLEKEKALGGVGGTGR